MNELTADLKPKVSRRSFMASLGLLGAAAGIRPLDVAAAPAPARDPATGLMKCRPYLQAPQTDQITVRWITHARSHSWVEYGENPAALNHKAWQVEDGLVQADNTIHAITLTGLQPGKTYHYRAVSREVKSLVRKEVTFGAIETSEVLTFRTMPERSKTAEFLLFNDIHDRPESFAQLMKFQDGGKKDFVFLNGDMFNFEESEEQIIKNLLDPLTHLFASHTPFYFGRGNHETWGDYSRQLRDYFDGRAQKYYYAIPHGPMYGIVLDSGESKPDDDLVHGGIHAFDAYRKAQAGWLEQEVQKPAFKAAKFRVVFVHIPPFYISQDIHASAHCRELWGPILNQAGIDLMLCGHTHKYGVHPAVPGQHHYPIVIGGGPKDGRRTLTHVKMDERSLSLTMTDDSGKQVGELNLTST